MEQHLQAIVTVWDRRAKVISKLEGKPEAPRFLSVFVA
jgi:hypothetical protein